MMFERMRPPNVYRILYGSARVRVKKRDCIFVRDRVKLFISQAGQVRDWVHC